MFSLAWNSVTKKKTLILPSSRGIFCKSFYNATVRYYTVLWDPLSQPLKLQIYSNHLEDVDCGFQA